MGGGGGEQPHRGELKKGRCGRARLTLGRGGGAQHARAGAGGRQRKGRGGREGNASYEEPCRPAGPRQLLLEATHTTEPGGRTARGLPGRCRVTRVMDVAAARAGDEGGRHGTGASACPRPAPSQPWLTAAAAAGLQAEGAQVDEGGVCEEGGRGRREGEGRNRRAGEPAATSTWWGMPPNCERPCSGWGLHATQHCSTHHTCRTAPARRR